MYVRVKTAIFKCSAFIRSSWSVTKPKAGTIHKATSSTNRSLVMIHDLPPEIIDGILRHFWDDRASLTSVSLVSSTFVAAARRQLFSEVVLEYSSICSFLELLNAPYCTVAPAITHIVIRGKRHKETFPKDLAPLDSASLISQLQGIQSITFQDIALDNIPPSFWRFLHSLKGVRDLELYQISLSSPAPFFQYVCNLPAFEALSISKSSVELTVYDSEVSHPKKSFSLPFLDVGRLSPGVLQWILAQQPVPPVHTLRINLGYVPQNVIALREFVGITGPSVNALHITLPSDMQLYSQIPRPIDFRSFSRVRTLRLEGYLRLGEQSESLQFKELLQTIFTEISSPEVEEVSLILSFGIDDAVILAGLAWDDNTTLLDIFSWAALPNFLGTNLRKFYLKLRGLPSFLRARVEDMWSNIALE
ncbi:hypothetical protein H0H81_001001 [Sphagnurus paluster]|uniref:F-box domain-containing protein n=1 Tax=Sphagnurus paluster TaxID=117069 RepID=A0A9P7FSU2_9AGAR|nr:hypothetical protein H0H81_001001 [Sphagnurus paluster]